MLTHCDAAEEVESVWTFDECGVNGCECTGRCTWRSQVIHKEELRDHWRNGEKGCWIRVDVAFV